MACDKRAKRQYENKIKTKLIIYTWMDVCTCCEWNISLHPPLPPHGVFCVKFLLCAISQINNFPHPTKVDVIFLYNAENNNDDNRVSLVFCLRSVPVSACLCSFFLGQISKNRLQFPVEIEIENSLANKKG